MRLLLLVLLASAAAAPRPRVQVEELTIADASARMAAGTLSAVQLTDAYLARIAALDDAGPHLDAVLALNPHARQDAAALDAERRAGRVRGPLHGIPILLKDNIDVAGMVTSAGALALADNVAPADAPVVARLRAAGAVILGKTNLSEWANFRSSVSASGWSGLGGQTRNPYVLDRTPCGSSSGSATAVAASLVMVAIGTETDGSLLCPASVQSLVGLKPTIGKVPGDGIVPIAPSQDTAGPIARTVADAAVVYRVLAGEPESLAAAPLPAGGPPLQGLRVGALRGPASEQAWVGPPYEAALDALRALGATVVDPLPQPDEARWADAELAVLTYEFKAELARYFLHATGPVRSLEAVLAWNRAHPDPWADQAILEASAAIGPLTDARYVEARAEARRLAWDEGLAPLFAQVDLVVTPATGPAWPTDRVLGDRLTASGWGPAAVAGTPSLTVPMGFAGELPLGLALLGGPGAEDRLLAVAAAFEQRTHARRPPRYLPTVP